MGLEDFERELTETKSRESREHRTRHHRDDERKHHHRHGHHELRREEGGESRGSRHKRHHDRHEDEDERRRRKRHQSDARRRGKEEMRTNVEVASEDGEDENKEDEWVEKELSTSLPLPDTLDQQNYNSSGTKIHRDAWMREPLEIEVDYVHSKKSEANKSHFVGATKSHNLNLRESETNQHLADLRLDFESDGENEAARSEMLVKPSQHDVSYTFGDSGSSWRMTKLKAIYRRAEELKRSVEEVALEQYGDLRDFDDAREEEREMDRRKLYGKEYVGLEKPSGELYQERKLKAGVRRESTYQESGMEETPRPDGVPISEKPSLSKTLSLDTTALNKLKAQMMRAKLKNASNAEQLEEEYNIASKASLAQQIQPGVIVLNNMENRMLAGGRSGEVTAVSGKRGRERGLVVENEDMSIEDMVRQERRTHGARGGEGRAFAERIAKDSKFVDNLDYMDDNATKLSKKVIQSETNLRSTAIGEFQQMQRVLEKCPLCYHEDSGNPPTAPVVSLGTRTFMTLPTEPEVAKSGAIIVPIQHHLNLLECDEDEWEEIRNFMKSLVRFYDSQDKSVIFYENAAFMHSRKGHAALVAVPLPHHLADTAPAYFKEAILASDAQWSQHRPIIDTLALAKRPGYGKAAFRKSMVKEMPYFHVFFTLDGGMGHVIEDERRWPKGDLFAREIIGGMLDKGPEVIKKQGRWERHDRRLENFRTKWDNYDWTKALMDAQ